MGAPLIQGKEAQAWAAGRQSRAVWRCTLTSPGPRQDRTGSTGCLRKSPAAGGESSGVRWSIPTRTLTGQKPRLIQRCSCVGACCECVSDLRIHFPFVDRSFRQASVEQGLTKGILMQGDLQQRATVRRAVTVLVLTVPTTNSRDCEQS